MSNASGLIIKNIFLYHIALIANLIKAKANLVCLLLDQAEQMCELVKMAEEEGFEPPVPCGTSVFKTDAIGRSATLPKMNINIILKN
jgi:hypothetical protein